jgi:hypothetical protein
VVSTDGLIGKEAKTLLKKLSSLWLKSGRSLTRSCGYVNAQVSIAIELHCCEALVFQPNEPIAVLSGKATPDSVFTVITPRLQSSLNCHFAELSN